jgi:hypothetical protein
MKYDPKGSFNEPVLRCFRCHALIQAKRIVTDGACLKCGSKKVANLGNSAVTEAEFNQMKEWGVDPDFLAEFQEVPDA